MTVLKSEEIRNLWKKSDVYVWPGSYWMVSFELSNRIRAIELASAVPQNFYTSIICDQHKVVLILHDSVWHNYKKENIHRTDYGPLSCLTAPVDRALVFVTNR